MSKPSAAILKMLSENRELIADSLHPFWHRTAEDLVSAGLDRASVADSLLTVGVAHSAAAIGGKKLADLLRDIADFHERLAEDDATKIRARH